MKKYSVSQREIYCKNTEQNIKFKPSNSSTVLYGGAKHDNINKL